MDRLKLPPIMKWSFYSGLGKQWGDAPIIFVERLLRTSGATFPSESSSLSEEQPRYCPANRNCQNGSICAHFGLDNWRSMIAEGKMMSVWF
ncbi:hypothetical protein CDAR_475871 [Caerostris darwini]|uniref:Uncharacterized protein n=1 Tax=Caerostris darwini TaxID=1538125 RepID=A0AAV4P842_9ARAC|nr:hypothetical protein CDAR_475871 [Caerostris darwini]